MFGIAIFLLGLVLAQDFSLAANEITLGVRAEGWVRRIESHRLANGQCKMVFMPGEFEEKPVILNLWGDNGSYSESSPFSFADGKEKYWLGVNYDEGSGTRSLTIAIKEFIPYPDGGGREGRNLAWTTLENLNPSDSTPYLTLHLDLGETPDGCFKQLIFALRRIAVAG